MRKLEKLKLHNLEEICVEEQRSIKGGNNNDEAIINGGMIGEVEVYGRSSHSVSFIWWEQFSFFNYMGTGSGFNGTNNGSSQPGNESGGGTSAYNGPLLGDITIIPEPRLAAIIMANPSVTLANVHISKIADGAEATQNMADAAEGLRVCTSNYSDAKGDMVSLSQCLLIGIETLAQSFKFSISEIAGGDHSAASTHYLGNSLDVNMVNNHHVNIRSMSNDDIIAFREAAFAAGATKVLDPLNEPTQHFNHFHIEW